MSGIGLPKGMNRDDAYVQGMADAEERILKNLEAALKAKKFIVTNHTTDFEHGWNDGINSALVIIQKIIVI